MNATELNQLILAIYRDTHRIPLESFKEHLLLALQEQLDFDKAVWLTGSTLNGVTASGISLLNVNPQMIEDYQRYKEGDILVPLAVTRPFTAHSLTRLESYQEWLSSDNCLKYAHPYDMHYVTSISAKEEQSALFSVITLYRNQDHEDFSDQELNTIETVFPHLIEAHRQSLFLYLANPPSEQDKQANWAYAVCDEQGVLIQADDFFSDILRKQWADWQGPFLPKDLTEKLDKEQVEFEKVSVRIERSGDVLSLKLAHRSILDNLTPQEFKISEKVKLGLSNKEIAKELALSPSTIKNHLSNIMRKLNLGKRSQLASLMVEHS